MKVYNDNPERFEANGNAWVASANDRVIWIKYEFKKISGSHVV